MAKLYEARDGKMVPVQTSKAPNAHLMFSWVQRVYIGSNNKTHRVELKKIVNFFTNTLGIKGFTLFKTLGYFEGKPEKSVVVEIVGTLPNGKLINSKNIENLRILLGQYSIIVATSKLWYMSVEK